MVLLLSGRPEVQILLATSKEMPGILGFQSFRYFTISEFANQNGVSANYPKRFAEHTNFFVGGFY